MYTRIRHLLFLFFLLFAFGSQASIITAVADGDWNDNSTWDNTHPGCYDSIVIPEGITVTIKST